jgi:hypothetical protein
VTQVARRQKASALYSLAAKGELPQGGGSLDEMAEISRTKRGNGGFREHKERERGKERENESLGRWGLSSAAAVAGAVAVVAGSR